jgi:hypothetical protein
MAKKNKKATSAYEPDPKTADAAEGNEKAKTEDKGAEDIHAEALKEYERAYNHARKNIELAYDDLRFKEGEGQWDAQARQERQAEGRPILTVDKTSQFVRQVTGDMRQMRPAIKVVPVDTTGDKDVAEKILPGMIRYIEQRSDAQGAYFAGADSQVSCGIGAWRVVTEHAGETTMLQEIGVEGIEDAVSVLYDPDATKPTREDGMFTFVPVDMSRAAFEAKYPEKSADALDSSPELFRTWSTADSVRVAEYWYKESEKRKLAVMPDGSVDDITDADEELLEAIQGQGAELEERDGFCVYRAVISASDVLEGPTKWPGRYIPIVPALGEEIKIGREIVRRGVIRPLKDVQRVYNYALSAEAEVVALQPKTPYKGTHKNFEKFQDQWETINSKNWPFVEYEPDPANGGVAPQREPPPAGSVGLQQLMQVSSADMNAVTGIYPAAMGAESNEISGKAILARQRQGDTGTYVYIDNFTRALRHTGRILLDLIPHVYDTARTIRIVGDDGKVDLVQLNQPQLSPQDGITPITLNDVTIGAYDVVVEMGASFATKREEARDGMQALMQALGPQVAPMFIDLFAKMQDWPLADQIAKRARFMLPPQIQQAEAQESGEAPPPQMPPPPPSPEQQMAMEKHQSEMQQGQTQQQMDMAKLQFEQGKFQAEMAIRAREIEAEIEKARLDHHATMAGHAAALDAANANAAATAPAEDPRVDQLAQAVAQLRDMVMQIAQAVQQPQPAPDAGPPMAPAGPAPIQAPPGAFSSPAPQPLG